MKTVLTIIKSHQVDIFKNQELEDRIIFRLISFLYDLLNKIDYKIGSLSNQEHTVHDSLGIIDTLGSSRSEGRFTFSHSEELGGYWGVKLLKGYRITVIYDCNNYHDLIIERIK